MMTRDQIQTVLTALEGLNVPYGGRKQAIAILQAALAEPSEPVAWRYRTKADWNANWSNWVPCSKEQYEDYVKVSKLHDWVYDAQALFTHPASKPLESDKDFCQAIAERDEYHDMADKLAEGIALHFDGDIGEHSSSNSPWDRALDLLDSAACAETMRLTRPAKPEPSEPHAWIIPMTQGKPMLTMDKVFADGARDIDGKDVVPLFTHPASNQLDEIAKVLHYPDCWDVMAYPTLEDAIIEAKSWAHCTNDDCQCPTKEA